MRWFLSVFFLSAVLGAAAPVSAAGEKGPAGSSPVAALQLYLDGFHFHNGAMKDQIEAHHWCEQLNPDLVQCVVYDGNGPGAHLMGIEYVVSEKLFRTLPPEERKLWHSHHFEVRSGQLIAPGLPPDKEHELMASLVSTYGKTWHTWQLHKPGHELPVGIPSLMMGFTAEGQADPKLVERRDAAFGVSSEKLAAERSDIPLPELVPGANSWEKGEVLQLGLEKKAQ